MHVLPAVGITLNDTFSKCNNNLSVLHNQRYSGSVLGIRRKILKSGHLLG